MDKQVIRNNNARKFEQSARIHRGCLRFNRKNGYLHYLNQFALCFDAFKNGEAFLTEAVLDTANLNERLRADFVNLDTKTVVEIAVTEHPDELKRKRVIWKRHGFEMVIYDELSGH